VFLESTFPYVDNVPDMSIIPEMYAFPTRLMLEFPEMSPSTKIPFMLMFLPIYTEFPMSALVDTSIMVEDMSFFYPEGV
jgi:hypothetical protein